MTINVAALPEVVNRVARPGTSDSWREDQMNKAKQKKLEEKGWKVGTAEEFLGLSPAESRCIELKLTLSESDSGHTLGTVE